MARRPRFLAFAAALLAFAALAPAARAVTLPDSTVREAWKLANGLEVRTVHVPNAAAIAVTVAYRAGRGYEPAGLEGLADLLSEIQWTSAAGPTPERTREELTTSRPMGWDSQTGSRLVRFTEIVTPQQLPGILQEEARRMSGVTVTDADVKSALATVRRDRGRHYFGEVSDVLYWRVAAAAQGANDERLVRLAGTPALEKYGARDVTPWLKRWYHAGNASVALAGNLDGIDVKALMQSLFGALPGGTANPDTVEVRYASAKRVSPWKDLATPAAALGVIPPPLADSLHPGFYLGMLITGPALVRAWGAATPPLTSRFQYALLDEPELVRFYPPMAASTTDPDVAAGALYEQLMVLGGQNVTASVLTRVKRSVSWLLGDELPTDLRAMLRKDPSGLGTLANGAATRALWRGDAFWADYLDRFDRSTLGHNYFYSWITAPEHQSIVLLTARH